MSESKSKVNAPAQVIKRDGSAVPFDESKIADAIYAAARSVGGNDFRLARELAQQVTRQLNNTFTSERIYIEDIQDTVEKILIEAGHAMTAKEYILYREKRAELRKQILVREGRDSRADIVVDMRSSERLLPWDKSRISSALLREYKLPAEIACDIASKVEQKIFSSEMTRISTGLIRELVDNELFDRGMTSLLGSNPMISLPPVNMEQYLSGSADKREATPADFNGTISRDVLRQYSMQSVYAPDITAYHGQGDLHLHHLGNINRMVRRRHCGPISGQAPADALSGLALQLAELQPFFVDFPRLDYFNILFAPLVRSLSDAELRTSIRGFLQLLRQMYVGSAARGMIELDLYGYIPEQLVAMAVDEIFPSLGDENAGGVYKDYYREMSTLANVLLDEMPHIAGLTGCMRINVHCTPFFQEDPSEKILLERLYAFALEGAEVEFNFDNGDTDFDQRMELLCGGDIEFHQVSLNLARLFFQIPIIGVEETIENFKGVFATALYSGIEKLDFASTLMRRPGQILWGLGRRGNGDPLFDVMNAYMTVRFCGVHEALLYSRMADINGEDIMYEMAGIADDIIDSKGDENPFDVHIRQGEADSASFRFAEADLERFPEKRELLSVDSNGRLHYEGIPCFYGDDPVPIVRSVRERLMYPDVPVGAGVLAVVPGAQIDKFHTFVSVIDGILDLDWFQSIIFKHI